MRSVDVYMSLIRSRARLTYDAVADYLATGSPGTIPPAVLPTLRWLRTAAARLSTVRAARGGVEIDREEAYISLDEATHEPTAIAARGDTDAHRLIERLMVAANEAVATWLVDRGLPGMFRVHDTPTPDKVEMLARFAHNFGIEAGFGRELSPRGLAAFEAQFRGSSIAPAIRTVLGKTLGTARYTVHPGLHFGLAAPLYLHFTSPIRRYADLAVHRIIKRYLGGDRSQLAGDPALETLAHHVNRAARRAGKAEAERHRMLVARLFASRIGEHFTGNIVSIKPFGLVVQMVGTGATGTVAMDALPAARTGSKPTATASPTAKTATASATRSTSRSPAPTRSWAGSTSCRSRCKRVSMSTTATLVGPRLLVVGSGGIGGVVAAHLFEQGHDVTALTTNQLIADAINAGGFRVRGEGSPGVVRGRAVTSIPKSAAPFDYILLATQPPQVEEAARSVLPHLALNGAMVCFQNGLCEERIAAIAGSDRTLGAIVAWGRVDGRARRLRSHLGRRLRPPAACTSATP